MAMLLKEKSNISVLEAQSKKWSPAYVRIATSLTERINKGCWSSGEQLPREVNLAQEYAVSRVTIRNALQLLEDNLLIQRLQGKGTFLAKKEESVPSRTVQQVGFVFVDFSKDHPVSVSELDHAVSYLEHEDVALACATLSTDDIVRGKHPVILEKKLCEGLIIDGHVRDFHLSYFDRWNIPYVVIGGYHLKRRVNRVWSDVQAGLIAGCQALIEDKQQPLVLLTVSNPYSSELTASVIAAYYQVAHQYPCYTTGVELREAGEELALCAQIKRRFDGRFSIVTRNSRVLALIEAYRHHGLDIKRNPILAFGSSRAFPQEYKDQICRIPIDLGQLSVLAVRRLLCLCNGSASDQLDIRVPAVLQRIGLGSKSSGDMNLQENGK